MLKFCPECGGETVEGMRFCPECGNDLSAVRAELDAAEQAPNNDIVTDKQPPQKSTAAPKQPPQQKKPEPTYTRAEQMELVKKQFYYEMKDNSVVVTRLIGEPKKIYIPDVVKVIASNAFFGKDSIEVIEGGRCVTHIGSWAFSSLTKLKSIELSDCIESIDNDAFYGCESLTALRFPDTVRTFGQGIAAFCNSLTEISVAKGNRTYASDANNSYIYSKHGDVVMGTNRTVLPNDGSIKTICPSAFCQCDRLVDFTVPHGVTQIQNNAFSDCAGLSVVHLPDTLESLDINAFYGCVNLQRIMFAGTKKQWKSIAKGKHWDKNTGRYKVFYCEL